MPDKAQQDEALDVLKNTWRKFPQLRLMQLLINVCPVEDLYYITDEQLLTNLKKYENKP